MRLRDLIRNIAGSLFTSADKYNWYDDLQERLGGAYSPDRITQKQKNMEEATAFFNSNWDRVEKIKSWLYDDKSKEIYENLIRFAMTGDRKYHHGCDPNQYFPKDVIQLESDEVFIDCGGYTADTTLDFVKRTKTKGGVQESSNI